MKRLLPLLLLWLLLPFGLRATHVVGSSLTYEHLGGSTYRITLKMYRDCLPGNSAFPGSVRVEVRDTAGNSFLPDRDITLNFTTATIVNPAIDSCAVDPGLCLEEAIYTRVVNTLPPQPGGYHLFVQYCCRNYSLVNTNSNSTTNLGTSWYTYIPNNAQVITNSSPVWVQPPPVFVCAQQPIDFDYSATDLDGDSLVYSFFTPYEDDPPTFVNGQCIFPTITFLPGFGPVNPTGGAPLTLDPQTGFLSGSPPFIGQFVAGIRCEEYRNGVKIGEIVRDFQFNVVFCPPLAQSVIGVPAQACLSNNNTIQFDNQSTGNASTWFWDFGDTTVTTDTSSLFEPAYTYPGIGPFDVTLIINPNTPCADTTVLQVEFSTVTANIISGADSVCVGTAVSFTDSSSVSGNASITGYWWDFGDGFQSNVQNPVHVYLSSGTYTVLHSATNSLGCQDTVPYIINVLAPPIALAGSDTVACYNNAGIGLGGSVLNVTGGLWTGAGTFTPSATVLNATYQPTVAELNAGFAVLALQTTGPTLCSHDVDSVRITFGPAPTANAGADITVCVDTPYVNVCASITLSTGGVWSTTGSGSFSTPTQLCTDYFPSQADRNAGSVILYLTTTGNGNCLPVTDSVLVTFTAVPSIVFTVPDTACSNVPFTITATTGTGSGYWTTLGDGSFPGGDTALTTTYLPGPADLANGQVQLVFHTLLNGGCRQQSDTVSVVIIPAPNSIFSHSNVCPDVAMSFTDQSTSVTPIISWLWNFGDSASGAANTSSLASPQHLYPAGGFYNVSLTTVSANGCPDTELRQIFVYPFPQAAFNTNGFCLKDGTIFNDLSTVDTGSVTGWQWQFGDNSTSAQQLPLHYYNSPGVYNVSLIAISNFGCRDTVTQPVDIYPSPTAQFTSNPFGYGNTMQQIQFTDQSFSNIASWLWNWGDSTAPSVVPNPSHAWQQAGTYIVTLVVADTNGCTDTALTEYIISTPPDVPSGFSPNGDGQNDVFQVFGGPFTNLEVRIYNNWGELIFTSTSQANSWDGTRDGIPQAVGVYVYTVRATTPDGRDYFLSGDVTLLR
ncbi:MAG: PKD domain-containing protein [Bacteroidia bacterium]|nr:PKD domain-containing protein [Bacteroidia bacterium]